MRCLLWLRDTDSSQMLLLVVAVLNMPSNKYSLQQILSALPPVELLSCEPTVPEWDGKQKKVFLKMSIKDLLLTAAQLNVTIKLCFLTSSSLLTGTRLIIKWSLPVRPTLSRFSLWVDLLSPRGGNNFLMTLLNCKMCGVYYLGRRGLWRLVWFLQLNIFLSFSIWWHGWKNKQKN